MVHWRYSVSRLIAFLLQNIIENLKNIDINDLGKRVCLKKRSYTHTHQTQTITKII